MLLPASAVLAALKLAPLAGEGGFVRQTWRADNGAGSAAYFLMTAAGFSALHRLQADEVWHFYAGDPVEHVTLDLATGGAVVARLGTDLTAGERPQVVVPRGVWQGARPANAQTGSSARLRAGWSLVGCTLTPAWEERAFELGAREALLREFPGAAEWVRTLTRA
ncbi:MAG: cupin domain-containing protein [Verrucomicrobia bacterium]|nr:cupin domain-containing protein [Verrucomicrobiota bacterium]